MKSYTSQIIGTSESFILQWSSKLALHDPLNPELNGDRSERVFFIGMERRQFVTHIHKNSEKEWKF